MLSPSLLTWLASIPKIALHALDIGSITYQGRVAEEKLNAMAVAARLNHALPELRAGIDVFARVLRPMPRFLAVEDAAAGRIHGRIRLTSDPRQAYQCSTNAPGQRWPEQRGRRLSLSRR